MLRESNFLKVVNKAHYPFLMSGVLLSLAVFMLLVITLFGGGSDLIVMAGGTELFLYLLANSMSALVVVNLERFIGRCVLAYLINLLALALIIALFSGGIPEDLKETYPVYLALIVSFGLSLAVIILIRQVLSILKGK
jgi:hypothetical protein